jgi:predicted nucleic acid-binding protein
MRVVVDTSIWSLALRRQRKRLSLPQRSLVLLLKDLIVSGDAILLCVVRQELLTGISSEQTFEDMCQHLRDFDDLPPDVDDYERAASAANDCIRGGTAPTTTDMLICAVAMGRDLAILTSDGDFEEYAKHLSIRLFPHP